MDQLEELIQATQTIEITADREKLITLLNEMSPEDLLIGLYRRLVQAGRIDN